MSEYKYKWQVVLTNGAPPGKFLDEQVLPGLTPAGEWYPFAATARLVSWRRPLQPEVQKPKRTRKKADPAPSDE